MQGLRNFFVCCCYSGQFFTAEWYLPSEDGGDHGVLRCMETNINTGRSKVNHGGEGRSGGIKDGPRR